ncbi:hypothetical protein [uncultured Maribacter sp.]|uniref:hypothetical protein n=1 Tax=uncultured Maribacter sp. TaxID=431308 RepID=UPI00261B87F4|nr:hypothetical protein [uncultured Maribacter sp.]
MFIEKQISTSKRDLDISKFLVKIEHSYIHIIQLKGRLCSYTYEPRTSDLHEKLEELKLRIELLCISHLNLMTKLKTPVNFIEVPKQQVEEQIREALLIEKAISAYMIMAK